MYCSFTICELQERRHAWHNASQCEAHAAIVLWLTTLLQFCIEMYTRVSSANKTGLLTADCLVLNHVFADLKGLVSKIRRVNLQKAKEWITGTLVKLACGCRAASHNAYRPAAIPNPQSQNLTLLNELDQYIRCSHPCHTPAHFLWLWSWHC